MLTAPLPPFAILRRPLPRLPIQIVPFNILTFFAEAAVVPDYAAVLHSPEVELLRRNRVVETHMQTVCVFVAGAHRQFVAGCAAEDVLLVCVGAWAHCACCCRSVFGMSRVMAAWWVFCVPVRSHFCMWSVSCL